MYRAFARDVMYTFMRLLVYKLFTSLSTVHVFHLLQPLAVQLIPFSRALPRLAA
jgi:hypothetical protein